MIPLRPRDRDYTQNLGVCFFLKGVFGWLPCHSSPHKLKQEELMAKPVCEAETRRCLQTSHFKKHVNLYAFLQ